ncbi:TetR/AcrR family transcriptional regulator [Micromonospora mangrovi]
MGRWEPNASGRLLQAAIELFSEAGYEATTAAQIAERAGLTKTTLFRHFTDKREILFQGQEPLVALAVEGVESAGPGSTPFQALRAGVLALCAGHAGQQRETCRQLDAILSSSAELRERAVFKRSAITQALHQALAARLGDARQAAVLADLGVRAYYDGFASWIAAGDDRCLTDAVSGELDAYQAMLVSVTWPPPDAPTSGRTAERSGTGSRRDGARSPDGGVSPPQ